jgi:hypothetical protein
MSGGAVAERAESDAVVVESGDSRGNAVEGESGDSGGKSKTVELPTTEGASSNGGESVV